MISLRLSLISLASSLSIFDNHSFIYSYKGTLLQISNVDYKIIFKSTDEAFFGYRGLILNESEKYVVIENRKCVSIVKICDE